MTLYIVRHGESEGNVERRHQTPTEVLTGKGENQARLLATRFTSVKVDRLIASTMTRAQQTATEISKIVNVEVESNESFVELRLPKEVRGKSHADQNSMQVLAQVNAHQEDPSYHYSDEENIFDFIKRLDTGLQSVISHSSDNDVIVLVVHGYVIRVLLGLILFGTDFSPLLFRLLNAKVKTSNTGITKVEYSPETGWELITFNDHAHLLE